MPVRVTLPSTLHRTESTHSLNFTASTLIDTKDGECDTECDTVAEDCEEIPKFTNPFSKRHMPMKISPSLTLRTFARRMSMPARRLSEHITTTFHLTPSSPFTCREETDSSSYFSRPRNHHTRHLPVVEMKKVKEEKEEVEVKLVEVEVVKVKRVNRVARVERWVTEQKDIVAEAPIVPPMTPAVSRRKETGLRERAHRKVSRTLQRVRHSI
ncbi:hypothetical protein DXG03_003662 [Asterophora parasitica]|uniref:Uncharacterized protein n=1 Tax=Asterophora parasitica TaxID=117018 RepID=A0A9P7GB91_9AGAR|nr:hypothetical protein DXG03_003662 [Asterophora parasitica]